MTSVTTPRPDFLEPLVATSPKSSKDEQSPKSESVDLSNHEAYMEEHYYKPERENQKERVANFLAMEWESLSFWERRLDLLMRLKWPYVKKRAWSADDLQSVNVLNQGIEEAEKRIAELTLENDNYDEYEYEEDEDAY
jgi:hypothetical protein